MSEFSVNESLIHTARNGDKAAMNELVAALAPVVEKIAGAYVNNYPLTRSDLIQEGMIGLLSSVYSYRDDGTAGFKTYASRCISNRIRSAVRNQLRAKHMPLNGYVPLDTLELTDMLADPQTTVDMQERMAIIRERIQNDLTELERDVLRLHIAGHNYAFIAEHLSISAKTVDNALQRARKKLKERRY